MNKSFLTRTLSGMVLVLLIAFFGIIGGTPLYMAVYVLSLVGLFELYRVAGMEKGAPAMAGWVACVVYYEMVDLGLAQKYFFVFAVLFMMLMMAIYVFTFPKYSAEKIIMAYFGVMYVPVLLSFVYLVREGNGDGRYTFWLIFISSWVCDTFAYLAGVILGKHKMAPNLSPKKTVEGAIGGLLGAAAVGAVYGAVVGKYLESTGKAALLFAVIGFLGGMVSMVGDLFASAIKRNYGIKDYGKLIPGHGGVLDRFDSVIITAPLIYILIKFFG